MVGESAVARSQPLWGWGSQSPEVSFLFPVWCQLPPSTCPVAAGHLDAAEAVRRCPGDGDWKDSRLDLQSVRVGREY